MHDNVRHGIVAYLASGIQCINRETLYKTIIATSHDLNFHFHIHVHIILQLVGTSTRC